MPIYTDVTDRRVIAKTPEEVRPIQFEFGTRICKDEEVLTAVCTLESGAGLTTADLPFETKAAWGKVSGGTAGTTYVIRATITTMIGSNPTGYTYTLNRIIQVADI